MVKRWIVPAAFTLVSALGLGTAQAANILASEDGDRGTLVGSQFDVTAFVVIASGLEFAEGSGSFLATSTASGQALVVLLEGADGPYSDWFFINYRSNVSSGFGAEDVRVSWRSDSESLGLPDFPSFGVTPMFLVETGGVQDITALLAASATASGFPFPSNITIQVQSDEPEPLPEPATLILTGLGLAGVGTRYRRRRRDSSK